MAHGAIFYVNVYLINDILFLLFYFNTLVYYAVYKRLHDCLTQRINDVLKMSITNFLNITLSRKMINAWAINITVMEYIRYERVILFMAHES